MGKSFEYQVAEAAVETGRPLLDKEIFQNMKKIIIPHTVRCKMCGMTEEFAATEWDVFRMNHGLNVHLAKEKFGENIGSIIATGLCQVCMDR